jgi:hypothetical protein
MPYKNKKVRTKYHKIYYSKHKDKILRIAKKYIKLHKIKVSIYQKNYRKKHKEKIKQYNEQHKKKINLQMRKWRKENRKKITHYIRQRRNNNLDIKLKDYLRNRLYQTLKGLYKSKSILKLLGCSINFLKNHLEKLFAKGMNWQNYGKWHIDHIKPCASFDLSKPEEQRKCFHYKNLQPLWAKENYIKHDNIIKEE